MIKLVLIALMLFPLLGTASCQAGGVFPPGEYQPEADVAPQPAKTGNHPTEEEYAEILEQYWSHGRRHPPSSDAERAAQLAEAIENQDPALLPVCTMEEIEARRAGAPVPAKSYEPWKHLDQLGCRLPPPKRESIEWGPPSEPGPRGQKDPHGRGW